VTQFERVVPVLIEKADTLSPEDAVELQRAAYVFAHAHAATHAVDAQLIASTTWNALEVTAGQAHNELQALATDRSVGRIGVISGCADQMLEHLKVVPPGPRERRTKSAAAAVEDLQRELERIRLAAKEAIDATALGLSRQVAEATARSDALFAELQVAVTAERERLAAIDADARVHVDQQSSAAQSLKETVDRESARLTTLSSDWTTRLQTIADRGKSESDRVRDAGIESFRVKLEESVANWEDEASRVKTATDEELAFFRSQHERVLMILGVTAASEAAGTYLQEANAQKRQGDFWRLAAVAAFTAGAVVAFIQADGIASAVRGLTDAEITAVTAVRIAAAAVPLSGAGWLARQVAHHRDRERAARRMASELTAFRPFIAELSDPTKHIEEAVGRYFPGHGNGALR